MKVTDAIKSTCFACNDRDCSNGYYRCVQCSAFQVCADCMVHAAQPEPAPPVVHAAQPEPAPPVEKKPRRAKIPRGNVGPFLGAAAAASAASAASADGLAASAASADGLAAPAASAASASLQRLLVVLRGHICRQGNMLSNNFDGDIGTFEEVLAGLRQMLSTLEAAEFRLHIAFDVVAVEATKEERAQMEKLINDNVPM